MATRFGSVRWHRISRSISRARLAAGCALLSGLALAPLPAAAAGPTFTPLHEFLGPRYADGGYVNAAPALDAAGNLYGTTFYGGTPACGATYGCGIVFRLVPPTKTHPAWAYEILHRFQGAPDGNFPYGGVVLDPSGNVYGSTDEGGTSDLGAAYMLVPPTKGQKIWKERVIANFAGGASDGKYPYGGLARDTTGALYGTTYEGGNVACASGCGTVFQLVPNAAKTLWTKHIIWLFQGGTNDGAVPYGYAGAGLVVTPTRGIYGTTYEGGSAGVGTIFYLHPTNTPTWSEMLLHSFAGGASDGAYPYANPVLAKDGTLYGTTYYGGPANYGVIYALKLVKPAPVYNVLYNFPGQNSADAGTPYSGLALDAAGMLYGMSYYGGDPRCYEGYGCGAVFKYNPKSPATPPTILHSFEGTDGLWPYGSATVDAKGRVFGFSSYGGAACFVESDGCGTAFMIAP